ncbi:hypothetical protein CKAN_00063700 [Cinnamomum micranthum f. kanehirae]|uniref:NAC domain-containing protein n=1 Tax=Cinnamomum micranthum f. kanehirae TaxID=337451 RepID=A0A443N1N3_9MAGN|nr:hypothetical protein CKAN_00063700 [Cinnamomum micranthum f. kanehirae]
MIGEKNITRGGKTIGCKTTLSFHRGKEGKEKKTCWNMHEYKLPRENGKRKRIYKRRSFEKSCEGHNEELTSISSITNNEIDASFDLINSWQSPTFVSNDLEQILSDVTPTECLENYYQLPESSDSFEMLQRFLMEDVN